MKRHILVLDGLRGVAALCVVFFHFGGRLPDFAPMQHGYLAVDFFFALSGFVIAYAYEERLRDGMSLGRFLLARVIRLMPLLLLGLCLGALLEFGRPNAGDFHSHMLDVALAFLFGSLVIPLPVSLSLEQVVFPLNSVIWSLFFEIAINAAYAACVHRLRTPVLVAIIGISAPMLVATSLYFDGLDCGSGLENWWGGTPRVLFSFSLGVLLYRLRDSVILSRFSAPVPLLSAVLVAVLAVPHLAAPLGWLFDLVVVMLVFPPLVIAGSNTSAGAYDRLCRFGGNLSYPLYVLHYRLVSVVTYKIKAMGLGPSGQAVTAVVATALFAAFAYAAFRLYDEPVRALLSRRWPGKRDGPVVALSAPS